MDKCTKEIKVYRCGLNVVTRIGNIKSMITGINIRFDRVHYEISYFVDGNYKAVWVDQNEFAVISKQKDVFMVIGFRQDE